MMRVNRHTGIVVAEASRPERDARTAGDAPAPAPETKWFGIEPRVVIAAGLLGLLAYGVYTHDPAPAPRRRRRFEDPYLLPRPKGAALGFSRRGDSGDEAFLRADQSIDEEFEYADEGDLDEDAIEEIEESVEDDHDSDEEDE